MRRMRKDVSAIRRLHCNSLHAPDSSEKRLRRTMRKKRHRSGGWAFDNSKAEASHVQRLALAGDVFPHDDLKGAMNFAENLRDCAIRGINESNAAIREAETPEDADYACHERSFWQGVDAACTAIRRGTTVSI